jgi:hypothetical protein
MCFFKDGAYIPEINWEKKQEFKDWKEWKLSFWDFIYSVSKDSSF